MLAGQARVSDNAIRWIEQGKTKTPEAATVRKLVEALGGDVDHAMRLLTASPPPAGYPQRVLEEVDWIRFGDLSAGPGIWEEAPYPAPRWLTRRRRVAAFRVRGTSMEPEVPEGSVVLVLLEPDEIRPGNIVVAWTPDGGVIKRRG